MNNASLIGVGYTQSLRPGRQPLRYGDFITVVVGYRRLPILLSPGIKVTLSALFDGKNFSNGGHKMGMGFELEA